MVRHFSFAFPTTLSEKVGGINNFAIGSLFLYVLLATAIVYLEDCHGRKHKCRALLDPGSQSNFLTEEVAKKLGLSCNPFSGRFTGLARKVSNVYSWTQTRLHSRVTSFETSLRCLVIPRITDDLPNVAIDSNVISIPSNLKLADPHFYQTGKIDILLGGGLFWKLLCVGQTNLGSNLPTIQKTQLGWIVAGGMCLFPCYGRPKLECQLVTNEDLQNQLKKFWAIEEPNYPHKIVNNECEAYFQKTTIRDNNVRFVVKIPFKPEINELGDSRVMAEKRFYALERKFCKNPAQKGEYCTFMKEYEDLGHMTRITDCKAQKLQFFLPHHAVFKQTSTTTKLRVVFDGSAKTSSGLSLNEVQQVGPTVQDDLMSIALRFRKHKYVLSADIEKMYRQVQIAPEERRFQRILWRPDDTQPIQTFELNTVTYGTASAPFLATRALMQLGKNHAVSFPSASRAIIKDFYVDDLLTGASSIDEARKLRREISDILHSAGFPLRKWASNDSRILDNEDEGPQRVEDVPECREYPCVLIGTTHRGFELFEKFSSYNRLIRVTAYCLRFIRNIRKLQDLKPTVDDKHDSISSKLLNIKELEIARKVLLKLAQRDTFATELHTLRQTKTVSKSSRLPSLNPFLDPDGLIRLGGRLANAKLSYDERFPIILSSKHPLTDLIILHEHSQLLHGGCQLVIASIRRKYWPLSCRLIVRNLLRKCIRCFRVKPNTVNYTMGGLPASRVTPSRAFSTCGVDYAGPFPIREKSRCRVIIKAYLCVFVCFVTKAVHLELASDLSTQAFFNCLRRFIARRGKCNTIYSDNGTNFVGARNELNDLGILLLTEKHRTQISDFCTVIGIQWHFIPPHVPHFGGLWESAVKSAKYHLKRVVGQTNLTFEELYTMITQVESCMNSRPLCPLTDDPSDLTPLTPSHFLIGGVLTSLPEPDLRDVKPSRLIRYQHLQYMLQHFWTRWQKEYLHQLQQRNKWMEGITAKFGPGTLVIVKDDNAPPLKWHMGRIIELHPGKDNVTRVVSIKLSDSVIKRPVTKICILPLEDDSSIQLETVNSDKQA
ncbi:uncharacterized protein LOC143181054 [Calliopsis andreniformis]|uniref:uncharacterized protein LOC143181054 n=1 Tax=Calliopsis andreniformis TaxID=337506 RepID=UPI003FCC6403